MTERMTKSEFIATLAEKSGITKQEAAAALKTMNEMVANQLRKQGAGEILIPGLLKLNVVVKSTIAAAAEAAPSRWSPPYLSQNVAGS